MFKKVLVVEDLDTVGYGIVMMLQNELGIPQVDYCQYCNEAYLKFKSAALQENPYDLLITDLSFKKDYRQAKIDSGQKLIATIREQGFATPIIICSVEENWGRIKRFLTKQHIAAYVLKGRNGLKDLKHAIEKAAQGEGFLSPVLRPALNGSPSFEIAEYDILLLNHLSNGSSQGQIADFLRGKGISPNSLSSIEKRLNRLKDVLKAKNNVQLVANAKDLGLI